MHANSHTHVHMQKHNLALTHTTNIHNVHCTKHIYPKPHITYFSSNMHIHFQDSIFYTHARTRMLTHSMNKKFTHAITNTHTNMNETYSIHFLGGGGRKDDLIVMPLLSMYINAIFQLNSEI